jgi:hypothetical protein
MALVKGNEDGVKAKTVNRPDLKYTVVHSCPQGIHSKTPGGLQKVQIILKLISTR